MRVIKWYVDASFVVHPNFKIHIGGIIMWGTGATQYGSIKQKVNTRYIMEAEVVGDEDMVSKILWKELFIEDQGYNVEKNILYQDKNSSILLDMNRSKSDFNISRSMNIRYFFVTDQVEK